VPAAAHATTARQRACVRASPAVLDGAQLHAVAGLPPIDALRGTLAFTAGHLQPSTLTGQWLGGPVSLGVAERREPDVTALAISGRGLVDVRQALLAAGAGDDAHLAGNAEWSALLRSSRRRMRAARRWRVRGRFRT